MIYLNDAIKQIMDLNYQLYEITGSRPNTLIVGNEIVTLLIMEGIKPTRIFFESFQTTMFHWGIIAGLKILSHIPN